MPPLLQLSSRKREFLPSFFLLFFPFLSFSRSSLPLSPSLAKKKVDATRSAPVQDPRTKNAVIRVDENAHRVI